MFDDLLTDIKILSKHCNFVIHVTMALSEIVSLPDSIVTNLGESYYLRTNWI